MNDHLSALFDATCDRLRDLRDRNAIGPWDDHTLEEAITQLEWVADQLRTIIASANNQ